MVFRYLVTDFKKFSILQSKRFSNSNIKKLSSVKARVRKKIEWTVLTIYLFMNCMGMDPWCDHRLTRWSIVHTLQNNKTSRLVSRSLSLTRLRWEITAKVPAQPKWISSRDWEEGEELLTVPQIAVATSTTQTLLQASTLLLQWPLTNQYTMASFITRNRDEIVQKTFDHPKIWTRLSRITRNLNKVKFTWSMDHPHHKLKLSLKKTLYLAFLKGTI